MLRKQVFDLVLCKEAKSNESQSKQGYITCERKPPLLKNADEHQFLKRKLRLFAFSLLNFLLTLALKI